MYEIPSLKIIKVNNEKNPEIIEKYDVKGFPTIIFFKDGEVVDQICGAMPIENFYDVLAKYLYE